ncbi:MAG: DUF2336 domain-containing protein [Alphaproteobacteria bacterium]|nr:DUF2336 domain-containing protein [Alphaproteobacteria bacterium]
MLNRDEILRLLEARGEATHAELAARTDAGPDVLNFLAEQGGPAARRAVAANIAAPPVANRHLAHDTSSDVREELARKIGRILPGISADAGAEIREITFETLEILAQDQMPRVRAILAEEIKSLACVPKKIIDRLARDVELVSAPILEYSPLLSDADLIDIITTAQARHVIMSIARRRTLSANVADAVAQARDIPSVKVLLENASADIRRQTLDKIADQAERIREWHSPLAQRPDLSQRAILRIASFVGSSLLEKLLQRNGLDESLKTHLSAQLRQRLEAGDTGDNAPSAQGEVHALHAKGKLDENYVAQAADDGRREAVIAALSLLSGAKQDAVARILQARAAKPVIALVWRAGLGMRVAMRIQSSLLKLTARELVPARGGIGFPLTEEEMRWHLGYFDVPA